MISLMISLCVDVLLLWVAMHVFRLSYSFICVYAYALGYDPTAICPANLWPYYPCNSENQNPERLNILKASGLE